METPDQKHCPICDHYLPIAKFGIVRAREDGRNLYCMECINTKARKNRKALREYKAAKKKHIVQFGFTEPFADEFQAEKPVSPFTLSPVDRVRNAIRKGFHTQPQIRTETKLTKDEIGDALANLLLWTKEIKTRVVGDTRMYFINEPVEIQSYPQRASLVEIARKGLGPVMKGERRVRAVA